MGRKCTVCIHPNRETIDSDLLKPETSVRALAQTTGLSASSLNRHRMDHLPKLMSRAIEQRKAEGKPDLFDLVAPAVPAAVKQHEVTEQAAAQNLADQAEDQRTKELVLADGLLDKVLTLETEAKDILEKAKKANTLKTALMAIDRVGHMIELQAKLIGKIKEGQVNIQNNLVYLTQKQLEEEWSKQPPT